MKILLATISNRRSGATGAAAEMVRGYLGRASRYAPCSQKGYVSEEEFLRSIESSAGRTRPFLLLTDREGQQLESADIAEVFRFVKDSGIQQLLIAIGPADGWSAAAQKRADKVLAFGRITLPHELAAVVTAEQIYRALTILAGHPYHCGH